MEREQKLSRDDYGGLVAEYFEKQSKFKKLETKFKAIKKDFYCTMEKYHNKFGLDEFEVEELADTTKIYAKRIQTTSVTFDADKLEQVLDKNIAKDVIFKKYEIFDMDSLVKYLRECNVDPKVFKSFLTVTKTVDVKELERLEEIGKLDMEQIRGCYNVKVNDPYYKVVKEKAKGDCD